MKSVGIASLVVCTMLSVAPEFVSAQSDSLSAGVEPGATPWYKTRKTWATAAVAGQAVIGTYLGYKWWWEGNFHAFHYENDGFLNNYSLGIDKVGHFYTSYFYYNLLREVLLWGGYDEDVADGWGAGLSMFSALTVEIGDGFSTYSFSGDDLLANAMGLAYGYAQHRVPFLRNFSFKWSYFPSGKIPFDGSFRITDDYDGHIYWLAVNVRGLLPERIADSWPRFLNLAIGYGGVNVSGRPAWVTGTPIQPNTGPRLRRWVFALDYRLTELPGASDTWVMVKRVLDLLHYPAPAIDKVQGRPARFNPLLYR